jgi:hypothetical protein
MDQESRTYSTDHIYLCAFLVCVGHRIVAASHDGRRVSFEFPDTPQLNADVSGFMAGAAVPARRFSFEVLRLKRMIHGGEYKLEKINEHDEHGCSGNSVQIQES